MTIRIEEIREFDKAQAYWGAWKSILEESETNTVYQSPEWMKSWWSCYAGSGRLLLLFAFEQDVLVGIAPLMAAKRRINGVLEEVVEFLGAENFASDYCDFIVPATRTDVLEALLEWLWQARRHWTVLRLNNIPAHSKHYSAILDYWRRRQLPFPAPTLREAPTCLLKDPAEQRRVLSKKSLKRHFNYFAKNGALSFRHLENLEEIQALLPVFFEQHRGRWAGTPYPSLFHDRNTCDFYHSVAQQLFDAGWLRFSVVEFDHAPIAFHFGFEYGGRYIWYKPSFDISLAKRSPGEVLLKFLLEYAVEQGVDEFDFTLGGEAFKYRFANLIRLNAEVLIFRRRTSYLFFMLRRALSALYKSLVKNPVSVHVRN